MLLVENLQQIYICGSSGCSIHSQGISLCMQVRAAFPGEGEVRTQILSSVRHLSGDQRINEVLFVTCLGRTAISISV